VQVLIDIFICATYYTYNNNVLLNSVHVANRMLLTRSVRIQNSSVQVLIDIFICATYCKYNKNEKQVIIIIIIIIVIYITILFAHCMLLTRSVRILKCAGDQHYHYYYYYYYYQYYYYYYYYYYLLYYATHHVKYKNKKHMTLS
jgi:hypothetical protein